MIKYLSVLVFIFFTGCFSSNTITPPKPETYTTTREYPNISKDAIFEAIKRVFIISGGKEFRIDSYRDNLEVSKTKVSIYPLYVYSTDDIWNIAIEELDNKSIVKVTLKRIKEYNKEEATYLSKDLHELLLDRAEYLLGLKDSWRWCKTAFTLDDAFCDFVDLHVYTQPTKDDMVKNILISERKASKGLAQINDDILADDVIFTVDDSNDDILEKADEKLEESTAEDDSFDKKIQELDDKVNKNIDKTLKKIENKEDDK